MVGDRTKEVKTEENMTGDKKTRKHMKTGQNKRQIRSKQERR